MTSQYGNLLPVALEAMDVANDYVRTQMPGAITTKGDRDMASEVDFAVERIVRARLGEQTPSIGMLGEEEGITGRERGDLIWTLDPVDGTANLVHGLPLCAISLGLLHQTRPVLGIIDLPFLGARYSAVEHEGAYANGQRIQASRTNGLREAIVGIGDYAVGSNAEEKNRLRLKLTQFLASHAQRIRMHGSAAVDLAWVAEGKLDASITLSNKPWDVAAGLVIAQEAGATLADKDGTPHRSDSAATIAAAPGVVEEIVKLISRAEDELAHT